MDSLFISEDLKGRVTTQVQIQGSGFGATRKEAIEDAEQNMLKLQTVLITGSLPYKLKIVKLDTISPLLGERFLYSIFLAGLSDIMPPCFCRGQAPALLYNSQAYLSASLLGGKACPTKHPYQTGFP